MTFPWTKFGYEVWTRLKLGKKLGRRIRKWRNKRRVKRGLPPLPEDHAMALPQNTLRKTGVGLAAAGPIIGVILGYIGVGECTPEELEMGCVGASQISAALVTLLGGAIYWIGQNRAHKRDVGDQPKE